MNNLALMVDVGNSIISFGVFKDGVLDKRLDVESSINSVALIKPQLEKFIVDEEINISDFKGGLICSVVPSYSKSLKKAIKEVLNIDVNIMTSEYVNDVKMVVENKEEVGGDLAADVVAAKAIYGNSCLVIDLGTISKSLVIDKSGAFIGTSFFPGVQICIEAMREKTALLPGIDLSNVPNKVFGNNTVEAMQTGIYHATMAGIEGYAKKVEEKLGYKLKKILTGGNSAIFKDSLSEFVVDKDLVLKGIYLIYKNN